MSRDARPPWWDLPVTLLVCFGVVILITTFIAKPFSIPSGSMENTFQVGDRVLVNRLVYHFRPIERGDVVVFDGTDSFVPAGEQVSVNPIAAAATWLGRSVGLVQPEGTDFIKRVIGVGGDTVACCDAEGRVTVNGVPLQEESYLYPGDAPSDQAFEVVVPEGMMWVMGDHRSNSADSRAHLGDPGGGMVPQGKVVGRAMNVLWPIPRIGSVPIPETFAGIPPSGSEG